MRGSAAEDAEAHHQCSAAFDEAATGERGAEDIRGLLEELFHDAYPFFAMRLEAKRTASMIAT